MDSPSSLMCAALASCVDGAIRMIADLQGVRLTALEVEVTGELDVRGCLVVDRGVRVGFEGLQCTIRLAAAGTERRKVESLVAAAERACVNLDTLIGGVAITTATEIGGVEQE